MLTYHHIKWLLAVLFLCFLTAAFADEPEALGPDKWPETVEAVTKMIIADMPEKNRLIIKGTKWQDLIKYHHGWGTGIRNHYGLWRGNQKLLLAACGKPCHPDDASVIIIEAVWVELQK